MKCHGLATRLLPSTVLIALASARTLREFADVLTPSEYGKEIAGLREVTERSLEQIFNKVLIERFRYVVNISSGNLKTFFTAYSNRFEVRNLTRILRGKASNASVSEIRVGLIDLRELSTIDFETLLLAENLEAAITFLKGTHYERLKEYIGSWHKYRSLIPLEYSLKALYYDRLFAHLRRLPRTVKAPLQELLGLEVDLVNCFTSLSPIVYGYTRDLMESLIIPFSHKVPLSRFMEAIKAKTPQEAYDALITYAPVVEHILSKREERAEAEGLKLLRRRAELIMQENFIEPPYILSYLVLSELECRDLTLMVLALRHGLDHKSLLSYEI